MNWKSMMICTGVLFAGAMGLAACGEDGDVACESDADCSGDEFCIGPEGAKECEILCKSDADCTKEGEACVQVQDAARGGATVCDPAPNEQCTTNAECTNGGTCVEGFCQAPTNQCTADTDCPTAGDICQDGTCVTPSTNSCSTTADCVADTSYCADLGGGTSSCLDVACGSDLNSCGRCALGPNGGNRDSAGPVLFFPEQVGNCTQDPNQCLPGAAPFVCEFSFLAFDPTGDLPTSGLNSKINVISRTGSRLTVFGAKSAAQGNNTKYNFRACFPETSSRAIGTAVVLKDNGGNDSQTLCVDGTL